MTNSHSGTSAFALAAVCLASLMFGLEISSVPVILPILEKVLHGSFNELQWVMNAYTIACTAVLMAAGTLADRFGRKRLFVISIALFGITSLICGLAQSMGVLIVSRFLQGMSGGIMLITQIAILSEQFQGARKRGRAFGIWGIVFGIGLGFGPIIGGLIVAAIDWKWVFLVHVAIAALTLVLALGGVKESRDPDAKRLDIFGMITFSLAVFCLVYFITQGPSLGFTSTIALSILAVSAASLIAFIIIEMTHTYPMFDFSVFRVRNFSGALLGSMAMNFSFWPFMIYMPIYFQGGLGYGSVATGLALLAYTLPTLIFPPLGEKLSLHYQPGVVIPAGLFTIGLGFALMWLGSGGASASWLTMLPGSLLAGIGLGITNTPVTNTTTGSVQSSRAGMASGIDMSARMTSLAINIALMGFILVSGVASYIERIKPGIDVAKLHSTAEGVASGNIAGVEALLSAPVVREALIHGFGWVMLYGAVGVWILAAISFVVFRKGRVAAPSPA
ncbi:MFS transporter [Phyllobacterium sp. YR531]|uniref:MFS transporter n=1 Tax=Phyllobacterium sp. YR531 TaxID=1144343 RepID=UPI00026F86D2|nr:MFS transporter [Phyllobacterium sp. YR531]EJN05262.1 arabinose efflux permease family protein [Phyllobacterium sp. YR531]